MCPVTALLGTVAIESKLGAVFVSEAIGWREVMDTTKFEGISNLLEHGGMLLVGLGFPCV